MDSYLLDQVMSFSPANLAIATSGTVDCSAAKASSSTYDGSSKAASQKSRYTFAKASSVTSAMAPSRVEPSSGTKLASTRVRQAVPAQASAASRSDQTPKAA